MAQRIYKLDNMKAVLIFLVVFGHAIEGHTEGFSHFLYTLIFVFHMPLFAFCSGFVARFDGGRICKKLLYCYLLFQLLHWLFDTLVLGESLALQFTTPYWTLWYLLALAVWTLLLPLVERSTRRGRLTVLAVCVLAGLLAGYDATIDTTMSLSRILVFFPFFLLGHDLRQIAPDAAPAVLRQRGVKLAAVGSVLAIALVCLIFQDDIMARWLFGSRSYSAADYTALHRLLIYLAAFAFLIFALCFTPERKTRLTFIGRNSLSIYLMHSFCLMLLEKWDFFTRFADPTLPSLAISVAIVLIFAAPPVANLVNKLAVWPGLWLPRKK